MAIRYLVMFLILATLPGWAKCVCPTVTSAQAACDDVKASRQIFVGKVVSAKSASVPGDRYAGDPVAYTFAVEEAFRGVQGKTVVITTGGECETGFRVGQRYIFLGTSVCSATTTAEEGKWIIDSLRLHKRDPDAALLFGWVGRKARDGKTLASGFPGLKVLLSRKGENYQATSDSRGNFALASRSAGEYSLYWGSHLADRSSVVIAANTCTTISHEVATSSVSGRLRTTAYFHPDDIPITLIPVTARTPYREEDVLWTSVKDGAFTFRGVPEGDYWVASTRPTLPGQAPRFARPITVVARIQPAPR